MKKWKKRIVLTLLIAFALNFSNAATITTQAESKNVTAQYKKPVSKMLKKFDLYFGYSFGKGMKFKYDIYTRTTMVYYKNLSSIYGKSLDYAKNKCAADMKLYFGNKKMKLKKFSGYTWKQPSNLIVNKDNEICYVGGDWGEEVPTWKIVNILKNGKKYSVSYDMNMKDTLTNTYYRYMGRLKITLKKAKNKNGFVITDIKRVRTENVNI